MAKVSPRYIRDGRSPIPVSEVVSRVMSANRGKNTFPELKLRKNLSELGISRYRLHSMLLPGRPDIYFPKHKIAVFVNGCFWHRCPSCQYGLPKSNRAFWRNKFKNNIARDTANLLKMRRLGWKSIVIWECKLKSNAGREAMRVYRAIRRS